ncbi:hypothetical protein [Eubacterium limosum]|uniref:hypothetical protein n=1 Tax=Eubacterium limosum TaxID=1736 RepID=UPI00106311F4|nr:hypothetical protein [Eubacterium limosum]
MSKFDEFDLDLKVDNGVDGGSPRDGGTLGYVCLTAQLSLAYCEQYSELFDCFSENNTCSRDMGRSTCTACGSSKAGIARC